MHIQKKKKLQQKRIYKCFCSYVFVGTHTGCIPCLSFN
uniref:Uncharacterized protein n=1 Tax=Anguilla anguilla TaxID=7936 RepID=A0A0E9S2A5_ANGAN